MRHNHRLLKLILPLLCLVLLCSACIPRPVPAPTPAPSAAAPEGVSVHFIDVGQADCALLVSGDAAMLIDAGNNDDADLICAYLRAQGISRLDYVIGTHPHEDHIGSLDAVIRSFEIGTVILPRVQANTQTFEDVLDAVAQKGLRITTPVTGTTYTLGACSFTILGPNADYGEELNNWSVGVRLVCGDTAFVLCGDAEVQAEKDMIATGLDLRADVLKLNHHGSSTSSCAAFLAAVDPEAVVICCGADNDYGHPHRETLAAIRGMDVYRTDTQGTLVAQSDGKTVTWNVAPAATAQDTTQTYILNTNSMKFHFADCSGAADISPANRDEVTCSRQELINAGYSPCGRCNP